MKKRATFILLLCVCLYSLCSCVTDRPPENAAPDYVYALLNVGNREHITAYGRRIPYGCVPLFCRVNLDTGSYTPVCADATCLHTDADCIACCVSNYDVSADGKNICFEKPDAEYKTTTIYRLYDDFTVEKLHTGKYANRNVTLLSLNDCVIYNVTEVIKEPENPMYESGEFISRYYSVRGGETKLLKELKNEVLMLDKCDDQIVSIKLDEEGHFYYELLDHDLNKTGETRDPDVMSPDYYSFKREKSDDSATGYKKSIATRDGTVYELSDYASDYITLRDYEVFAEVDLVNWTDEEISEGMKVCYAFDYNTGEIKKIFDLADMPPEYSFDRFSSTEFFRFTASGGPKSGNRFILKINGSVNDVDEYGYEYRMGFVYYAVISAEDGSYKIVK